MLLKSGYLTSSYHIRNHSGGSGDGGIFIDDDEEEDAVITAAEGLVLETPQQRRPESEEGGEQHQTPGEGSASPASTAAEAALAMDNDTADPSLDDDPSFSPRNCPPPHGTQLLPCKLI